MNQPDLDDSDGGYSDYGDVEASGDGEAEGDGGDPTADGAAGQLAAATRSGRNCRSATDSCYVTGLPQIAAMSPGYLR